MTLASFGLEVFADGPEPDPALEGLPGLAAALDVGVIEAALTGVLASLGNGPRRELTSATLIDFKTGRRALIAYEIASSDGRSLVVLGKHFSDEAQARRVHAALLAADAATRGGTSRWDVPRPLGLVPELALVLYSPVRGRFLDELVGDADGDVALSSVAECLAELHSTPLSFDRCLDPMKEAASARTWARSVASAYPEHAHAAHGLATAFGAWAASPDDVDLTASIHKDVHYKHVLVGPRVTLIDLDEMRRGDANFDLAHFCAHLHLLALRTGTFGADLERRFLEAYDGATASARSGCFAPFFVYACLKIAWQLSLGLGVRPRPAGAERARQVKQLLGLGRARLQPAPGSAHETIGVRP